MKKVLIVAVALASVNAFATRARVSSLGNSPHLIDTQTVYSNPADMMTMGDYVNFESGATANGSATVMNGNTEGMITRSMGDAKFGFALGHQNQNASTWAGTTGADTGLRSPAITGIATIIGQQNPIGLSYATKMNDMLIGGTLIYSNYNDKAAAGIKESSAGIKLGLRTGPWDAKLGIGLTNTFENANTTQKFTGTGGLSGAVGYWMDDMYFDLYVDQSGFKTEVGGTEALKMDASNYHVGVLKSMKKDGSELFYGVALAMGARKVSAGAVDASKYTSTTLPITIGMEVDAASWLTMRGSVTQTTLINTTKDEGAAPPAPFEFAPGPNTTAAAIGAGIKYNKLNVDGTLTGVTTTAGAANQKVDGTNLLGMVGVTYMY